MFGRKRNLDDFSEEIDTHVQLEFEHPREPGHSREGSCPLSSNTVAHELTDFAWAGLELPGLSLLGQLCSVSGVPK
jgi:hypothetical protein